MPHTPLLLAGPNRHRRRTVQHPSLYRDRAEGAKLTDAAVRYFILHGCSQSAAARSVDPPCCPVALNRAIKALEKTGQWAAHVSDVRAAAQASGELHPTSSKDDFDLPTPGSLGRLIKSRATRLGDGRPYKGQGNS